MRNALLGLGVWSLSTAAFAGAHPPPGKRPPPIQTGQASYYGVHGAPTRTASGEKLKPNKMTAASPVLPLGAVAKVTNLKNGKSVRVKVTDRGPYARHRILDVSPKAAVRLGMKKDGVAPVAVKPMKLPKADERPATR